MPDLQDLVALVLLLLFGLLEAFFGYRIFRFVVFIGGLLVGIELAPQLYTSWFGAPPGQTEVLLFALAAGALFGLLAWLVFWAAVFLWGAWLGYSIAVGLGVPLLFAVLVAVVLGALAVVFQRVLIVAVTAFHGAWLATTAGASLFGLAVSLPPPFASRPLAPPDFGPLLAAVVVALALFGALSQARLGPRPARRRP